MMKNTLVIFLLVIGAGVSCAPGATDGELEQMCAHLKELRGKKIETDIEKCISEAKAEGVSRRQALCRISAVNTTEYFVRCRTGEARGE